MKLVPSRGLSRRRLFGLAWRAAVAALAVGGMARPAKAYRSQWGRWECQNDQCQPYIYDPTKGVPDFDIPPGIPFEDLPEDWVCPVCGDSKRQFQPFDD